MGTTDTCQITRTPARHCLMQADVQEINNNNMKYKMHLYVI